ncbi:MAG: class I SAM-dependent methyltransferase [Planctomycetales bacterium]|nr:class I SAM-dependent methyltransferase [Planctomycetales bacterium]
MNKIDVAELTEAQATLLMPLWARALESCRNDAVLRDSAAEQIVNSLDFDFTLFEAKAVPAIDYCLRASVFDQLVQRFLDRHPTATVVELGVGLDTRFDRLNNPGATWIELDLPAVMAVRQKFFQPCDRRTMLAASLLDDHWLDEVAERAAPDSPILFTCEGVLYFFQVPQIQQIFRRLADRFPQSGLIFDAQSPWFLRVSNWRHPMKDSQLKFSLGNVRSIQSWDPRLRVRDYVGFGDSPYYDRGMPRLSALRRWGRRLLPPIRHLFKVVHAEW